MKLRFIFTLLLFVILVGCSKKDEKPGGSGIIEADEIVVSSETTGKVLKRNFDEGTVIKAGDTLAVIDDEKLQLQLQSILASEKSAKANLASMEIKLKQAQETMDYMLNEQNRVTKLLESGTATTKQQDEIDHQLSQAELNVKTARAGIDAIKADINKIQSEAARVSQSIDDCYPVSAIDGVVTEKYVEEGELLAPGKPIAKVSNLQSIYVKVYLPTDDFANIKLGDKASIDTEADSGLFSGTVTWTSEEAEFTPKNIQTKKSRANMVYAVKVKINNNDGKLKIGMPVYVTLDDE